jgi:hypothetical protein
MLERHKGDGMVAFSLASILGNDPQSPSPVFTDNQGALKLAETGVLQSRTKHINVKFMHSHDE